MTDPKSRAPERLDQPSEPEADEQVEKEALRETQQQSTLRAAALDSSRLGNDEGGGKDQ